MLAKILCFVGLHDWYCIASSKLVVWTHGRPSERTHCGHESRFVCTRANCKATHYSREFYSGTKRRVWLRATP